MIKIFRKIRQNLIIENLPTGQAGKTSKYFKYAIGEIILVVIGILIALQLNTWKEELQAKEELKASMNSMLDDLSQDIEFYDFCTSIIEKRLLVINHFSDGNYDEIAIETLPLQLSFNVPTKKFGTTYLSLKEERKFNLINNSELKKNVASYYEVSCNQYSEYADWHKNFVTETIESYMLLNLPYKKGNKVDAQDVINSLENGKLLSIANFQITAHEDALAIVKKNKLLAEDLKKSIKAEFN